MTSKKYRISIAEGTGKGSASYSPIDVDNCDEFVKYLKEQGVKKFNLKYYSIIDDIPDFYEMGLSINYFKQEHFDWLTEKSKYQSRSLDISSRFIISNSNNNKMIIREKNFKIGTFHGTLKPVDGSKEAKLRNALYLIGNLNLKITNTKCIKIRLIGYEIPIEYRGKRIDLFGYDNQADKKNPWIIELKAHDSTEKITDVVQQITEYGKQLPLYLNKIEKEFYEKFFIKLELTANIKKMILAPREYYINQDKTNYPEMHDIYLCSIAKIKEVFTAKEIEADKKATELTLDSKLSQFDEITLKIENRR